MAEVIGFISIGAMIIVQVGVFSYHYGRLNQKVDSQGKRLERIENTLNGRAKSPSG